MSLYIDTHLFIYLLSFVNLVGLGRTFCKIAVLPITDSRKRTVVLTNNGGGFGSAFGGGFGGGLNSATKE